MNKRLKGEYMEFIYRGEKTPFTPGTLAVAIFCTVLLIVATFTKFDISHWWLFDSNGSLVFGLKKYQLVPQIPAVLFIAGLLGARYSTLVMFLYLLTGFFVWPVFGFGGGLEYVKSYFFGYILGFFAAAVLSGKILSNKYNTAGMIYASVIGVVSIHLSGLLYSLVLSLFLKSGYLPDFHHILTQVGYDIIFSFLAVIAVKPLKYVFWLAYSPSRKSN